MCGIVGFVSNHHRVEKTERVARMMDAIIHRGPDDAGTYVDQRVALGFRRLAIIDLETGHQPLANEDRSIWTIFNGEIYNFREKRAQLSGLGHAFKTKTDTETIVHAYEQWGDQFVDHLSGMFGFAVWDQNRRRLVLAVDRSGIKPLYFAEHADGIVFASEAKALFASGLVRCAPDYGTLPYHLTFLTAPFPRTMFQHVQKIPPGHTLVYENGKVTIRQYWDLPMVEQPENWQAQPYQRIATSLSSATRNQLTSDVPLGAFLSGGIDSSAICHFMKEQLADPLETYFIAFKPEDVANDVLIDEMPFATQMAESLGTVHHSIYASTDHLDELLPKLVWHMDEPIGDPAALTSYLVSQHARQTLTVLLSGVGGDEVFGGYPRYLAMALHQSFRRLPAVARSAAMWLGNRVPAGRSSLFRNLKKFTRSGALEAHDAYLRMLTYFTPEEHQKLLTADFYAEYCRDDVYQHHREYLAKAKGLSTIGQFQYLDFKTFLPCLNLMYTDKMSMAASIEVRVPFLDDGFVEEMFTLPPELKLRGRVRKYGLKRAMQGKLPSSVIWRKKAGFGSPIHAWIRGKMKDFVFDHLSEQRIKEQNIFNFQYIEEILRQELSNQQYYSNHIWQLLNVQLWLDAFFGNSSDGSLCTVRPATAASLLGNAG